MRTFQGRASEELYNEALTQLHNWLKTLHCATEPENAIEGALWIDNRNALKIKHNNEFITLYEDVYQSMEKLINPNQPTTPSPGQMWVNNDGALLYYNGIKWDTIKAATLEDFSMDGFEPFIIIDTLHAGMNEVIKKNSDIIEEEFIASEGATDFSLLKGQYQPMSNKMVVYINGRILPKAKYLEHNVVTVRLLEPLHQGERVMFQYISQDNKNTSSYVPLKFHPALKEEVILIKEPTHIIHLSNDCLMGEAYTMLYINGRFVGNHYYTIDDKRTIRVVAQLETNEEILVQYIDKITYETLPDGTVSPIQDETPYTQYIWPSSDYDRLFMNGKLNLDYETLNKISIQYPSRDVQGKAISAVHVHPKNLCEIKKSVYAIDKQTGKVQVDELNTEFYAITNNPIITPYDLEESELYLDKETLLVSTSEQTRSYLMYAQPSTQYRIRRQMVSDIFDVSMYDARPVLGDSCSDYFEITATDVIDATHAFTTGPETHFLLIQLSSEGGAWVPPMAETDCKTSKSLLLIKTDSSDTDYISTIGGIKLSPYITNTYDYIMAVTYVFGEITGRGYLSKVSFDITDDSQIIIGNINDPLLVFAQGHYLIEEGNYRYNKDTGKLTLLFPEQLDVGVLTFPRNQEGFILEQSSDGRGIIMLQKEMVKPLVFVYGEHLQQLMDYEQTGSLIQVTDAKVNMSYAVVDCVDAYGESMFVSEGHIEYDEKKELYYIPVMINLDVVEPILFVNGLLINKKDTFYEKNKLYLTNKADANMQYTLLKDSNGRFLHSDIKQPSTFATNVGADQSMLYIDGNLMCDIEAFGCQNLPEKGCQREIKGLMSYDTRKGYIVNNWFMYIENDWVEITDAKKCDELEAHLSHYILENKTVHFTNLNLIRNKRCYGWLYKYNETIEYPLMSYFREMGNNIRFETLPMHGFKVNQNCLSVYIDGYRQYPETATFPNGVKEIDDHTFEIGDSVPGSRLEYIIELPEHGEAKSCIAETLTSKDIYNQTLKTTIPLLPGFIDLFIDGIRQPKTSFEVVNRYNIVLHNFLKDPRYTNHLLIEVREDFYLKEAVREITKDGQFSFECIDDMRSLLFTKDLIKIYINGVYIAGDYSVVREHGMISIPKLVELGFAKKGHIVSFIWR